MSSQVKSKKVSPSQSENQAGPSVTGGPASSKKEGAESKTKGKGKAKADSAEAEKDEAKPTQSNNVKPLMLCNPVDPELPGTWRFLLDRNYVSKVVFEFSTFGSSVMVHMQTGQYSPDGVPILAVRSAKDALRVLRDMNILDRFNRIHESVRKVAPPQEGAAPNKKQGGALPKKSLCNEDFEGSVALLKSRVSAVAKALTFSTLKGRVGSVLQADTSAFPTMELLWAQLDGLARCKLLMDGKRYNTLIGSKAAMDAAEEMMRNVPVPFRGAIAPQKKAGFSSRDLEGSSEEEENSNPRNPEGPSYEPSDRHD